jgi:DNA-binding NtrC family response regulator|tara:strand:- start:9084 stop:10484 length:1401 start_codon:yes stop_codon:yes gene_type:complete
MRDIRILVVDDEKAICAICEQALSRLPNVSVTVEIRSSRAVKLCSSGSFDLLISDLNMPEVDGFELLRLSKETDPEVPVIIMTGYPSLDNSVECLRLGAADYVLKPLILDDLLATVTRVLEQRRLHEENRLLRRQLERKSSMGEILGDSEAMQRVRDSIARIADTDVDVLIWGETGTGKELVARNIHTSSPRCNKPFCPVDCSAIPAELFESEFFGHERGAFTGATERIPGLMEYADGGTLFLDEIGELSLPQQAKLLRALQERSFRRVGSREEVHVDIRLLAATNRDLSEEVKAKRFREELYFRINVGEIPLPPLKQRAGDIELLLEHFLDKFGKEMNRPGRVMKPEVVDLFYAHPWPGNVRELINVVRRMLAMSRRKTLSLDDVPAAIRSKLETQSHARGSGFMEERARTIEEFEYNYIVALLRTCAGDVSAAARMADVSRQSIYRLMQRLQIDAGEFRETSRA